MTKCVGAGIDKNVLPDYAQLLRQMKEGKTKETPDEVKTRIINRLNGGK